MMTMVNQEEETPQAQPQTADQEKEQPKQDPADPPHVETPKVPDADTEGIP
jgi:hypothetical protein